MIRFTQGDMFAVPADIRVNTVNCVGVMGAGVALAFKSRYPDMFKEYKKECDRGTVQPGKLHVWKNLMGDWVINFPTKRHWRDKSRYEDIESGLLALREYLQKAHGRSIALPALGCGHGGLDWDRVSQMIKRHLEGVDAEVLVFSPSDSRAVGEAVRAQNGAKNGVHSDEANAWPDVAMHEVPGDLDVKSVAVAGSESLYQRAALLIATSHKPEEQEQQATLACIHALARPDITISVCGGTRLARLTTEAALKAGANVVLWIAEGLSHHRPSSELLSQVQLGRVAVASVALAGQRWNQTLARQTLFAACRHSRVVLVTDPHPLWISKSPLTSDDSNARSVFFTNYQTLDPDLKKKLLSVHARPIGRRAETGEPKVEPLLTALGGEIAESSPQPPAEPEVRTAPTPTVQPVLSPSPTSMPNTYPKRLIEVDLPIRRISDHARREKSIRHGHISTLHIWWARRPLAACRAVLCAALWPDPVDERCPRAFTLIAAERMWRWAREERARISAGSASTFDLVRQHTSTFALTQHPTTLREALLDFIADFANWDSSTVPAFLDTARALTAAAHHGLSADADNAGFVQPMDEREWLKTLSALHAQLATSQRPLVVDPFAGGGSIPLEALRIGADAFASDLNPVPVLLNKVLLDYIPRFGEELLSAVKETCLTIEECAESALKPYFPVEKPGHTPLAYIWARTILSEAPGEGILPVEVPLLSSMWLSKKRHRGRALRWMRDVHGKVETEESEVRYADGTTHTVLRPKLEVVEVKSASEVESGTVKSGAATCPTSGYTTPPKSVRRQLSARKGGAADARLIAVVTIRSDVKGRFYRIANQEDVTAATAVQSGDSTVTLPHQPVPKRDSHRAVASLSVYGMETFGDLFSARQARVITTLIVCLRRALGDSLRPEQDLERATKVMVGLMVSKLTDYSSSLATWSSPASQETVRSTFGRQTLAMVWDFAEANAFAPSSGGWAHILKYFVKAIEHVIASKLERGTIVKADATQHPLPDDVAACFFTDPPYYDSIPYAELSDYFYVWLREILVNTEPEIFSEAATPKLKQAIVWHPHAENERRDYEAKMARAMAEGRRVSADGAIGVVVFAHKSTAGWESQLQAMIEAGWVITASWPIDTERSGRTNANNTASLASSIHLVVRPRGAADGTLRTDEVGDWRDVLAELPRRIHEWMPRLAEEGVVGADAIFACLGPALEIFSRYARVEKASGDPVPLREYLEHVWAAVALEALSLVFAGASAEGFEPDARLTAMWLWTLTAPQSANDAETDDDDSDDADDDTETTSTGKKAPKGFVLEYDAARKIAQGLGANLENLTHLVEVKGDQARLLPVAERTRHLFGKDQEASPLAVGKKKARDGQTNFLSELLGTAPGTPAAEAAWAEHTVTRVGETTLDRVHQSMILFAAGRGEALRRFLVDDAAGRDAKFWRLAQALSALYPKACEEKRWVDGVLARKKGLGL